MRRGVIFAIVLGLAVGLTEASILGGNGTTIDLTKPDATRQVTWSPQPEVGLTDKGLGWDGEAAASRDGWVMTSPMGVGLSWRPSRSLSVTLSVLPAPATFTLPNGQTSAHFEGRAFVRHSPDGVNWTNWQAMQRSKPRAGEPPGRYFTLSLEVPQVDQAGYNQLIAEYARKPNVPWASDEEAAVQWILGRQPDFFRGHKPFIGHVQVLFETGFGGGERLTKMSVATSFGVSGLHTPASDPAVAKDRDGPWRFTVPKPTTRPAP